MNTQFSFWQLVNKYEIEVPIVQRDYALGRKEDRVEQIRTLFVKALTDPLIGSNRSSVNLDFIYGSNYSGKLVLLDGQQRITTLFLLHWYIALRSDCLSQQVRTTLSNFTYQTRSTSREFCSKLIYECAVSVLDAKEPSARIRDSHWFRYVWNRDPTVKSMLVMINAIHERLRSEPIGTSIWDRLTDYESPAITFCFLNMAGFHLTDELYMKMNARGIPLSDFEGFKAWLEEYSERVEWGFPELDNGGWKQRMDIKWTDLFWRHRGEKTEIDDPFLELFRGAAMCSLAKTMAISKENRLSSDDSQRISLFRKKTYISTADYEEWDCFNQEAIRRCFSLLDHLSNEVGGVKLYDYCTNPDSYSDRLIAFAFSLFVTDVPLNEVEECTDANLLAWIRIVTNLTRNTRIDEVGFVRALRSLSTLWDRVSKNRTIDDWVLMAFAGMREEDIPFFREEQICEEIVKADLILRDRSWEPRLRNCEEHLYFYGQIGFLLKYSRCDSEYNQSLFDKYANRAKALFDHNILAHADHLVERALLTQGDYLIKTGLNRGFCLPANGTLEKRLENWRQVFGDPDGSRLLQKLLDQIDPDDVEASLLAIIDSQQGAYEWQRLFIECREAIDRCKLGMIRWVSEEKIYLLERRYVNTCCAELRTFHLWDQFLIPQLDRLDPFKKALYHDTHGPLEAHYAYLHEWQFRGVELELDIKYNGDRYALELCGKNDQAIPEVVTTRLKQEDFHFEEDGNRLKMSVNMTEIEDKLLQVTLELRTLNEHDRTT